MKLASLQSLCLLPALTGCRFPITEARLLSSRKVQPLPERIARQPLELELAGGGRLRGWRLVHPAPKATLIYFYGNGDSLWNSGRRLYTMADTYQVDVVCLDQRGNGFSDGVMGFQAMREDSLRIFDSARREGLPTLVMGYSLGSQSAAYLAANRPVDGLALLAGASSFEEALPAFRAKVPWLIRPFTRLTFDPIFTANPQARDLVATVKAPTLIIHGEADQTLPVACGDTFNQVSPAAWKRYLRLPGVGHEDLPMVSGASLSLIQAWIQAALPQPKAS
ncbi:MAG: alpha/beta fold hydrolase [Acidobacteria bacterium]|nr:alpha/beta fold hydrolase [Acidobacteriota bacterium]MBI3487758.1 alpha/beta fold hydrolase [Acidobacteriota bacterium]